MFRTDCLEISIALCTSTLYYSTFAWPELALKLSLNLENASINATRHMYSASNHCSKNIEYLLDNTRGNWNSSLHGTYPAYSTFRKKWFNHDDLPQDTTEPLLPTSLHCPNASSLVLRFGYTPHAHKSQRPLLVSRRSTWLADWQSQIFCGRSQKSVSAVRALRQTGRWDPRKRCLGGLLFKPYRS